MGRIVEWLERRPVTVQAMTSLFGSAALLVAALIAYLSIVTENKVERQFTLMDLAAGILAEANNNLEILTNDQEILSGSKRSQSDCYQIPFVLAFTEANISRIGRLPDPIPETSFKVYARLNAVDAWIRVSGVCSTAATENDRVILASRIDDLTRHISALRELATIFIQAPDSETPIQPSYTDYNFTSEASQWYDIAAPAYEEGAGPDSIEHHWLPADN